MDGPFGAPPRSAEVEPKAASAPPAHTGDGGGDVPRDASRWGTTEGGVTIDDERDRLAIVVVEGESGFDPDMYAEAHSDEEPPASEASEAGAEDSDFSAHSSEFEDSG